MPELENDDTGTMTHHICTNGIPEVREHNLATYRKLRIERFA